jgi:A/G-specific adenine glycosylase
MKNPIWIESLCRWFVKAQRQMPWRQTADPYKIWISEVMLQQTQVKTVIEYYLKFTQRFPTIKSLADANENEVLSLWSGLGYYSRARNLHKGAKYLLEKHQGNFPQTLEEALEIPGVGPYTAGAVLSIAYDLPVPVVDGNVQRVFSRLYLKTESPEKLTLFFWEKARELIKNVKSSKIYNQALMELGATVCTKYDPKCGSCPINKYCEAYKQGLQNEIPRAKKRQSQKNLHWVGYLYQQGDKFYLEKGKMRWWQEMWHFPVEETSLKNAKKIYKDAIKKNQALNRHIHYVTHHKIHLYPVVSQKKLKSKDWFTKEEILKMPVSSLVKKVVMEL